MTYWKSYLHPIRGKVTFKIWQFLQISIENLRSCNWNYRRDLVRHVNIWTLFTETSTILHARILRIFICVIFFARFSHCCKIFARQIYLKPSTFGGPSIHAIISNTRSTYTFFTPAKLQPKYPSFASIIAIAQTQNTLDSRDKME